MERINQELFDWSSWRSGTLLDFGCCNRTFSIRENKCLISKYSIGFCKSDNLLCRPKSHHFAVMFEINGNRFWTHFREQEFNLINF